MNENLLKTLAVGIFGAAAIILLGPSIANGAKPVVRRGIKAAVKGYAQSMETLAELQELAEDAYAEAMAELKEEAAGRTDRNEPASHPADEVTLAGKESSGEPKKKKRPRA